ncbi:MAG: hypothetical protein Q8L16_03475 [Hydrogenophaga sp.]|nr:hypothetical protein [Hylemonella sp.]MDP2019933.1 hypothetical protein [Hydrogenophaga sp.]
MNEQFEELLRFPREDLSTELKQWMDPADKLVQSKIAKELLALRNHGGGVLILGFKDENPAVPDPNRPPNWANFDTDYFNNILKAYADPLFHCDAHLIVHPDNGDKYPVVVVPGGGKVPVRCKAGSPDNGKTIAKDSYYVRRPGPESSPPQTSNDWDELLERCLHNRREELLAKLANLLGVGSGGVLAYLAAAPTVLEHPFKQLQEFREAGLSRLKKLQDEKLPAGDPARFEHGKYVLSVRFVGELKEVTQKQIVKLLQKLPKYTGWSPLYVFTRPELEPYSLGNDLVECWLARDESRDVTRADFWQVSTKGMVTLVRGFQEDSPELAGRDGNPAIGKGIELTLPPWRLAEFLLRVRTLGELLATGPYRIQLSAQWDGLAGRRLFSHGGRREIFEEYVSKDAIFHIEIDISPEEIEAALSLVLTRVLTPFYHRFSFFEPPEAFYEQELGRMLRRDLV